MATQTQKALAFSELLERPNSKLSDEYLRKIKLNMDLPGIENLPEEAQLQCNYYISNGNILYLEFTMSNASYSKDSLRLLRDIGFNQVYGELTYHGFKVNLLDNHKLFKLIQNIKTPITPCPKNYDDVVFGFLEQVKEDSVPKRISFVARNIIDKSLNLCGFISGDEPINHYMDSCPILHFEFIDGQYCISTDYEETKRLNLGILNYKSKEPLTAYEIFRNVQLGMDKDLRLLVILHFLVGRIKNVLPYDGIPFPETTDPLTIFNQQIDELQRKCLSPRDLAVEVSILSAKHLK